jgi:NADPH:quinone reductase-like Zn-dependent oxidoreductase
MVRHYGRWNYKENFMKAVVYRRYGPPEVLQLIELEKPIPKDDEILIKIQAASINALDWHRLTADIFLVRLMGEGLLKPKNIRLGADMAGRVEAVGKAVTQFQPGDEVFGDVEPYGSGAFSEYVCVPEKAVALKPANLSYEEAAAVPVAGLTALQGLRDYGQIQPGQKVLIYGASGGVGTFAVQIAKAFGAEVTAVCSPRNLDQASALGADHVIDYTRQDFAQNGQTYDLILGVNGYRPLSVYKRGLTSQGIYVMAGGKPAQIFQAMLLGPRMSPKGGKKLVGGMVKASQIDLEVMKGFLEAGKVQAVIDRRYPFSEFREAFEYFGEGHARAKVVISME